MEKLIQGTSTKLKELARTFSKTTSSPVWCACRLSPYLALFIRKSFYNHLGWSRSRTWLDYRKRQQARRLKCRVQS